MCLAYALSDVLAVDWLPPWPWGPAVVAIWMTTLGPESRSRRMVWVRPEVS